MRIINSSVVQIEQSPGMQGVYEMIEEAGRTCYKSIGTRYFRIPSKNTLDDKTTEMINKLKLDSRVSIKQGPFFDKSYYISIPNKFIKEYEHLQTFTEEKKSDSPLYENLTAREFVEMLTKNGHGAMLEHGTIYLSNIYETSDINGWMHSIGPKYASNRFSIVNLEDCMDFQTIYITTNLRVIAENDWWEDLKFMCEPTKYHEKRVSFRFICSRAIANEIVRHRVFSYAQESSRYCNYSKSKFDNQITYIRPEWLSEDFINNFYEVKDTSEEFLSKITYINALEESENFYKELINAGRTPQEARGVLPLDLKTELVMTGFKSDYNHFLELRCSKTAHPDIRVLAERVKEYLKE